MLALFGGFPLWWALGLSSVICIIAAVPMAVWLLAMGRVRVPRGFGWWLAFLFWMLLSATQLDEARRWYAFSYRGVLYLSMTVMFVYVYNLPRSAMPTRRIVLALALFWATVICFGFAALAAPNFRLTTPVSLLLPEPLATSARALPRSATRTAAYTRPAARPTHRPRLAEITIGTSEATSSTRMALRSRYERSMPMAARAIGVSRPTAPPHSLV